MAVELPESIQPITEATLAPATATSVVRAPESARPFSRPQISALTALANGGTLTEAADSAGVHRSTAYGWVCQPRFQITLENAQREHYVSIGTRLHALAGNALNALQQILDDPRCSPHARIKAANLIFQRLERGQPALPSTVQQSAAIHQQCQDKYAPHLVIGPVRQIQTLGEPIAATLPDTAEPVRQIQTELQAPPEPERQIQTPTEVPIVTNHDASDQVRQILTDIHPVNEESQKFHQAPSSLHSEERQT